MIKCLDLGISRSWVCQKSGYYLIPSYDFSEIGGRWLEIPNPARRWFTPWRPRTINKELFTSVSFPSGNYNRRYIYLGRHIRLAECDIEPKWDGEA